MFYLLLLHFWLHFLWDRREALFPKTAESLTFSVMIYVALITVFLIVGLFSFPFVFIAHFYYIFTKLSQWPPGHVLLQAYLYITEQNAE